MEYEHQLSNLIYDYLLYRFKFGYYNYGDSLPTVDVFCSQFNVSLHTIWAALRRLRTDGYIYMKNGRITKVIYKQTEQERIDFIIDYFSRRWNAYFDVYYAAELIYVPFMIEGFRRMNEEEISYLEQLAKRSSPDDNILFYSFTLQKIENPLLMNLFWETTLFLGYPFAKNGFRPFGYNIENGRKQLKFLVQLIKEGDWENVKNIVSQHQNIILDKLKENMEPQIRKVPEDEQISFVWRVYNGRPQVCYNLAPRLLHDIYMGEYSETEFLPSYEKLSGIYGVSVSTARRTISMLNQIGATQSINGKGTRILDITKSCIQPDFSSPAIRRNLSYLVQSLELLLYTCEEVSNHFFKNLLAKEREELISRFEENQRSGIGKLSIHTYLYFISCYSRIQTVRQIYGVIHGLLLWGHPLRVSSGAEDRMASRGMEFTRLMIQYMKVNDIEQCATVVKNYMKEQFPDGIRYLEQQGIASEELKMSSPIRLLILDE